MSNNPFKTLEKNWKDGIEKFQKKIKDDFENVKKVFQGSKNAEENWDEMLKDTDATVNKWKNDWEQMQKQNLEKMKNQTSLFKKNIDKNNEKVKKFFQDQQNAFNQKLDELKNKMQKSVEEDKQFNEDVKKAIKSNWETFKDGQKEVHENFMQMQNRLWWKGYVNFIIGMMVLVGVVVAIIKILQYFEILS